MKAAIVKEKGTIPIFGEFASPVAAEGQVMVNVTAVGLSRLSKFRSMGLHYTSELTFPLVAGFDGVGNLEDGSRVYFAMPTAPYGSLAEQTMVSEKVIIRLPDGIDDVTAAAIANPAMSSWAALKFRAHFKAGQTVLINGATGSSGSLAVQIAKSMGAHKVIVTGRNQSKLQALEADQEIAFDMAVDNGAKSFENALQPVIAEGVDIVLDYLWGESAIAILSAISKNSTNCVTRFVSIGTSAGKENIELPSSLLRSSKIELVGSGGNSISKLEMLSAVKDVFEQAAEGKINIATTEFSLEDIEEAWNAPLMPRAVVKIK